MFRQLLHEGTTLLRNSRPQTQDLQVSSVAGSDDKDMQF